MAPITRRTTLVKGFPRLRSAFVALLLSLPTACERPDPRLRPEQVLRDSLQLGDDDRVHRVQLLSQDNREAPEPAAVSVRPGDYVEFVTGDHRVHAIAFVLDSAAPAGAAFLRRTAQEGSPPLVVPEARFVVTFADAPPGRYPYLVIGNGAEGRGQVVVGEPER